MAKLTKNSENRIFVAVQTGSLSIVPFNDTLESIDGGEVNITESAEQKSTAFINATRGAVLVDGAMSVEDAIQKITAKN